MGHAVTIADFDIIAQGCVFNAKDKIYKKETPHVMRGFFYFYQTLAYSALSSCGLLERNARTAII